MNLNKFLFTICFIFISVMAGAQEKGYYSIGNNAEKLRIRNESRPVDSLYRTDKGYYSIEGNRGKLKRSLKEPEKAKQIPEVRKGYYSIGNNASKLRRQAE